MPEPTRLEVAIDEVRAALPAILAGERDYVYAAGLTQVEVNILAALIRREHMDTLTVYAGLLVPDGSLGFEFGLVRTQRVTEGPSLQESIAGKAAAENGKVVAMEGAKAN